ncbi:MAG: TolC family protein, partial [Firmicutes bacterium]|nr:TolC family protein [Bacillota bacterium]
YFPGGPLIASESTAWGRSLSLGTSKAFGWGGNLKLSYDPSYRYSWSQTSTGTSSTSNPYDGTLTATYSQSLLRNFGRIANESRLIVARKTSQAADFNYQLAIINLVANTESMYWDMVYALRNLENKRLALALAEKQLKENRIRVEVGTLAPIEVTSAEASVAQREQEILVAEAQARNAKDALLNMVYADSHKASALEPADAPILVPSPLSAEAAEKMALERRVELKSAQLDLESRQILEQAAGNRLLPQLDAYASYNGNAASQIPSEGLSAVNKDLFGSKYPGYSLGLTFSMPIGNRAAKGSQIQARASRRSSELALRDLRQNISLEVRTAFRNMEAAQKSVKAAEKTRVFREKDLDAEQKKYENGMSTNFLVLSKQNDLDSARAAELQAQIGYAKTITALEKAAGSLLEARKLEVK